MELEHFTKLIEVFETIQVFRPCDIEFDKKWHLEQLADVF